MITMIEGWTPGNAPAQIANLHTLFNVVTTLLLLPVGTWLGKIASLILRDRREAESVSGMHVQYLLDMNHTNTEKLGASVICMAGIQKELQRMLMMAERNVREAFAVFSLYEKEKYEAIERREECVDFLNKEISK